MTSKVETVLKNDGDGYETVVPIKYENGSSYWVKLANLFTDEYIDGFRTSYMVMMDVTGLTRAENEQEIPVGVVEVDVSRHLTDKHFIVIWANGCYYRMIGYTKESYETRFHNYCDAYFWDNEASSRTTNENIQSTTDADERSHEAYPPLKMPSGSMRWIKIVGFLTDKCMDGIRIAYTIMIDVTDSVQTQKERSIAYKDIPGPIVRHHILPQEIVMLDASERIKDILDVSMEDIAAIGPLEVMSGEDRELMISHFPGLRRGEPFEATMCVKDRYDRDQWSHFNSARIDTISDGPVYPSMLIDIADITELRELQRRLEGRIDMLNNALEAVEYASTAKSNFLSRMGHDIRTPVNVITGMAEIAAAYIGNQDYMRDCLQKIRLSSHYLLGLINDMLDMSKIENDNFSISVAPIYLLDELQEIITIALPDVHKINQRFDVYLEGPGWEGFINDALRFRQILLDLFSNASKFTPRDGRVILKMEMQGTESAKKAMICFTISDNRIGTSPEYLEQISEPFTREGDSRIDQIEGSGLGMTIMKCLIDLLGGTIIIESQLGMGTVFGVLVPMNILAGSEEEQKDFRGLHVLLVDDDPVRQACTGSLLHPVGMEVEYMGFREAGKRFLIY